MPSWARVLTPLGTAGLTSIHSRSSSPWKPTSVRQDGSRITWASAVTSSVVSIPSAPCTSTLASSLRASAGGGGDAGCASEPGMTPEVCATRRAFHKESGGCGAADPPYLSMHCAARQAVLRAALTWLSQRQLSSRLSHRSMLSEVSLQASTSLTKLSCSGRPLGGEESGIRGLGEVFFGVGTGVPVPLAGRCGHPCHDSAGPQHSPSPLQGPVQPLPLRVGGLGLCAPPRHPSLLRRLG